MSGPGQRGSEVRLLMRSAVTAALGTTLAEDGRAYTSLVLTACCCDGSPLLLLSDLALHAANIGADARVSLLFDGTHDLSDRLTGARASVLGRAEKWRDGAALARFVARQPSAAGYAGFGDFSLYKVSVERAHVVSGFGAIYWVDGGDIIGPEASDIAAQEGDVLAHMNADHGDAVALIGDRLGGPATTMAALAGDDAGSDDWHMIGVDRDGCDLRQGGQLRRTEFPAPLASAQEIRPAMFALSKQARAAA